MLNGFVPIVINVTYYWVKGEITATPRSLVVDRGVAVNSG